MTQRSLAVVLLLVLVCGCSSSLYTDFRYRSGRDVSLRALPALMLGRDKAWVIDRLGPPNVVLSRLGGDTFIYHDRNLDLTALNLHTGFVTPVAVSIYYDADGERNVVE